MPSSLHLSLAEYDSMIRVGAFDQIPRKVELLHGKLIQMNPAGPQHDYLITYLTNWSIRHSDPAKTLVTSQTGLNIPALASRPEPDLMWLKKANYRNAHPCANDVQLAIEVAYSSLKYDFEDKRKLYASAAIIEYWIVDVIAQSIHVFMEPKAGDYTFKQLYQVGKKLTPQVLPTASLDLKDLFVDDD